MMTAAASFAGFLPSPSRPCRPRSLRAQRVFLIVAMLAVFGWWPCTTASAGQILAGIAKVEISDPRVEPLHDPLYVKALVLKDEAAVVILTVDAVAIGEIGRIDNDFLARVQGQLEKDLKVDPAHVLVSATHCHGAVCSDIAERTVQAVKEAWQNLVPVKVGAGTGREDRISENRRMTLKDGSQVDMRRAYSMPPDEEVASIGPIDPQIGLLRLDREDGTPLAAVYNFACHPIMNPPSIGNTADFPGVASRVIEQSLGAGAIAMFVQGCCGDVNPVRYKQVLHPANAEPLGNALGISASRALREIETKGTGELQVIREFVDIPRATDQAQRIAAIQAEQAQLLQSLKPTDIDFTTFLPLWVQQQASPESPSYYAHGYLHDSALGIDELKRLDAANRASVDAYLANLRIMERLTRLNVNLALLQKHLAENQAAASPTLKIEIVGLQVGDFFLVAFPGEPSVEVGLNIKQRAAAPFSFVAGYCNGYIYYLPTARQRQNTGYAQEDCDCLVAPEWQAIVEGKALEILNRLAGPK